MKRLFILWAMVMGLSVGCLGHTIQPFHYIQAGGYSTVALKEYKVWVDADFGEADKLAIDDAVKQWNYALNGYVRIVVESYSFDMEIETINRVRNGEGWLIMKIHSGNPMIDDGPVGANGKPKFYTLAWVNAIGGRHMWVVRDRLQNEWMLGVMMHEMGHLLGAQHDDVYLMQPHFNWEDYRCVDYEALKRVADYQHLPMSRLNYCIYGERPTKGP